jgi:outer membrane protein OmpA-like peptidoglycan-associated protein
MKTARFLFAALALMLVSHLPAEAQFLERLGRAAARAAENAVTRQAEKRTEEAINKTIDGALDGQSEPEAEPQQPAAPAPAPTPVAESADPQTPAVQTPQAAQMAWNKFDFVSGDEIMFEDNLVGEQLGEFPSMWDIISGNVEVARLDGENVIAFVEKAEITPLMKEAKSYLPEIYTIEADFYKPAKGEADNGQFYFYVRDENGGEILSNCISTDVGENTGRFWGSYLSTGGEMRGTNETVSLTPGWHRISISFNKRALKVYIDERRVANMPNIAQGRWFSLYGAATTTNGGTYFVKNIRIAKGAVPLYDRMMSDGKFITYGITFDVGKSTIKPESMGEINRIVELMNENPTLKFSVEGHTDSTGNAASNQTLSEARSKAIVDKLVELGIAANRLTASGKGQNSPIADNATDEGRAKNRRVEFVKQ